MNTSTSTLQAAFAALLRGDTAERDRLCERASVLIVAEERASAMQRVLSIDFYVTASGVAVPTKRMAKAAGVIQ